MADRYWVGGTGSWSSTNTANWSTSSGGAGGASVPTAADNVIFDAGSDAGGIFTVTMANTPRVCNDFTASGLDFTMTLAGTSIGLTVSGSLEFPATNLTRTYTGVTTFNATTTGKTITTNGVAFGGGVTLDGVGGAWTLGSAFSCAGFILTLTNGTFDTSVSNYAVTASTFSSSNTNTRTINLNGSTLTFSTSGNSWNIATSTNATLNAGTSTIALSSDFGAQFTGGNLTYYNVSFTSTTSTIFTKSINGANTFNNLTFSTIGSIGLNNISIGANQTINGTLTVNGANGSQRQFIRSDTTGITRTLTCAAIASTTDVDFRDITIAGAHGTLSGTRLGDCKGNTNITFDAPKTVYYRQTGSANWGATGSGSWSATSGGALDATQFPLAQDTAVFPAATYPASGSTTTINAAYNIGTIDMSLRTSNTMTLATGSTNPVIYGNWINGTGVTLSGTGTIFFAGRTTQQITSASKTFAPITINSPSGSVTLQDALTVGTSSTTTLTSGTLDLNNFTLSTGRFNSNSTGTRTIAFGTGNITCTGTGTVWTTSTQTNLTTTGTQVVNVTSTGSTAITVNYGALNETNVISFNFTGGTYALTLFNNVTYARNIDFTGYAGTVGAVGISCRIYGNLTLSTGMTLTASSNALSFEATSGTKTITSNGKTMDFPLTFNGVGGTFQLQDALTVGTSSTTTLTSGTLDLNNFTLSTGLFSSNNSNTRTLAFGTGNITCTGTGTVWQMSTATSCTVTGTPVANITSVGSTSITVTPGVLSEANSINFNFTGGTYTLTFLESASFHTARNIDFTGYAGTWALATGNPVIYGNLKISTGMTIGTGTGEIAFSATSGTQQITSNGKTFDVAIDFNGVGGTFRLEDALTLGSSRKVDLINGTLDLNGKTLTLGGVGSGYFVISAGTKNITFNGGTLVIATASTIAFVNNNPTGFTTTAGTGTGTISMTAATAKTFAGGGSTFNCTLNQGGAGALTITGSNTFNDITNTVQPASVLFTAGTTSTFSNFSLSGTSGNLITIGSVSAASHTLSKASGTVSVSFCSISRSNATGGADWEAFTAAPYLNTNGGNNTGWDFGSTGNFLAFFL